MTACTCTCTYMLVLKRHVQYVSVCCHAHIPQLLTDQVGVVNFDPYKSLFMLTFSHSRTAITGIPLLPPLFTYPLRNWYYIPHQMHIVSTCILPRKLQDWDCTTCHDTLCCLCIMCLSTTRSTDIGVTAHYMAASWYKSVIPILSLLFVQSLSFFAVLWIVETD